MKHCPKCNSLHEKPGIFCGRKCANSRNFSQASIEKKSLANKKYYSQFTKEERKSMMQEKILKYDFVATQKKVQQANLMNSWNRPYEKMGQEALKKRLLFETKDTCEECGQQNIWNNKPLTLELHHIDGNSKNNKRENLQILCPNCHTQTPNHRGKNLTYQKEKNIANLIIDNNSQLNV